LRLARTSRNAPKLRPLTLPRARKAPAPVPLRRRAGPLAGILAKRIIYFDFDSSEIKGEGPGVVAAHARYLVANPTVRVRLEGHTDERGSREYNIGLGERRAQAVRRALLLQGATETQLSTVSYGAERPAAAGSNETAWAQNRRVEIVYLK
jgi:peptidoglycan-associated lipoprotein